MNPFLRKLVPGHESFSKKNYEQAIVLFTQAININPSFKYYHYRADAYHKNDKIEYALKDYIKSITINPKNNDRNIYSKIAGIYFDWEKFDEAIKYYTYAAQISPELCSNFFNLAITYIKIDNQKSAIEVLEKLLTIDENYVNAYIMLGKLFLEDKDTNKLKWCIEAIKERQKNPSRFWLDTVSYFEFIELEEEYQKLTSY